ncbi:hypothetical protein Hanom_Chr09g00773821 [Helianthus anomalus]
MKEARCRCYLGGYQNPVKTSPAIPLHKTPYFRRSCVFRPLLQYLSHATATIATLIPLSNLKEHH